MAFLKKYLTWLHLGFPAGRPNRLPEIDEEGRAGIPGVRLVGALGGSPLLKFAADSGARAMREMASELSQSRASQERIPGAGPDSEVVDVVIVGGGVSGVSAALEAQRFGLSFCIVEAERLFQTIQEFPEKKPIYRLPADWNPASTLKVEGDTRETLLESFEKQAESARLPWIQARVVGITRRSLDSGEKVLELQLAGAAAALSEAAQRRVPLARRVLLALGRAGSHRLLAVPGVDLPKVKTALGRAQDYTNKKVVVVGGGDSALEAVLALHEAGAQVHLVHRGERFERAQPALVKAVRERLPAERVLLESRIGEIRSDSIQVKTYPSPSILREFPNDFVFLMLGRELPTQFLKSLGISIAGERGARFWVSFALTFAAVLGVLSWKSPYGAVYQTFAERNWFPFFWSGHDWARILAQPGFWYELVYTAVIGLFGVRRVLRTPTSYVRKQTTVLFLVQAIPLFVLPYFVLPALGKQGWFDQGWGQWFADQFFPYDLEGKAREYWRAVGFVLAWPLFAWNVFSPDPKWGWLVVSLLQTFVILPILVMRYGKGIYCGWLCSCGALAETFGDARRGRMPHGKRWNALAVAGQVILLVALGIAAIRVASFVGLQFWPESPWVLTLETAFFNAVFAAKLGSISVSYYTVVDYFLSGVIGIGLFFHFSGRTWCRFFCPLAALMNVYARLGKFRIFAQKEKCISCNVCTSSCHMGIDVMSFAKEGKPMNDPQCVRCSACVAQCPTGTLQFGRFTSTGFVEYDRTDARTTH